MKRFVVAGVVVAAAGLGFAAPASADPYGLRRTCPQVTQRGPVIIATCYNAYMGLVQTSIDLRTCGGAPVANVNGRLVCGGGYAQPAPGYYGPPPGWRHRDRDWR